MRRALGVGTVSSVSVSISADVSADDDGNNNNAYVLPAALMPNVITDHLSPKCYLSSQFDSGTHTDGFDTLISPVKSWVSGKMKKRDTEKHWYQCTTVGGSLTFKLPHVHGISISVYKHSGMGAVDIYINDKYIQTLSSYLNASDPKWAWLPKGQGLADMISLDLISSDTDSNSNTGTNTDAGAGAGVSVFKVDESCDLKLTLRGGESAWDYHTKFQILAISHY